MKVIDYILFVSFVGLLGFANPASASQYSEEFHKELNFAIQDEKDNFDIRETNEMWFQSIKLNDSKSTVEMWTEVKPTKNIFLYQAGYVYGLYNQKMYNHFVIQAVTILNQVKKTTDLSQKLDHWLSKELDTLVSDGKVYLSQDIKNQMMQLIQSNKPFKSVPFFQAWIGMQDLNYALKNFDDLPTKTKMFEAIVEKHATQLLISNQNKKAIEFIKANSKNNVFLARAYFQNKEFKLAAQNFESLQKNHPDYVLTREELAWTYLHMGDWVSLRGLLQHLNNPVVAIEERTEGQVLSTVYNLHFCEYEKVEETLAQYQKEMLAWAKNIQAKKQELPIRDDGFILADKVKTQIDFEKQTAEKLSLPQKNQITFNSIEKEVAKNLEARKELYWKNQEKIAAESIKKMRFVKVEFLTEMKKIEKLARHKEIVLGSTVVASNDQVQTAELLAQAEKNGQMVFKVTDDLWVDEMFKVKGLTQSQCQKVKGAGL